MSIGLSYTSAPKFSAVCPVHIADTLNKAGALGDYNLVLAHDVVQHKKAYEFTYGRMGSWRTTILDNSVIELGDAVNIDMIVEAAIAVKANVIVLPDVLKDSAATIDRSREAFDTWTPQLKKYLKWDWSYMVVPQMDAANDIFDVRFSSFVACAEAFVDLPLVHWWGCPRNLVEPLGTRATALQCLRTLDGNKAVHMLGFSDDIIDDMLCALDPLYRVVGIDSAVPLRAASKGMRMKLSMDCVKDLGPRGDWWEAAEYNELMFDNMKIVRKWLEA